MARHSLSAAEKRAIDNAVARFDEHRHLFDGFAKSVVDYLRNDGELAPYIHFIKYRLKSARRLKEKLVKKALAQKRGSTHGITSETLFESVNDLAGIRILHLHTNQIDKINQHIKRVLEKNKIRIVEGPVVHCWDRDYENLFAKFGIPAKKLPDDPRSRGSMYTSVHYVLEANEKTKISFELQVRTLADELWGEVSHLVEYEEDKPNEHIQNQLKVLARLTSASTRLVDCIFDEFREGESTGIAKGEKRKG